MGNVLCILFSTYTVRITFFNNNTHIYFIHCESIGCQVGCLLVASRSRAVRLAVSVCILCRRPITSTTVRAATHSITKPLARVSGSDNSYLFPFRKQKRIRTAFSPSQLLHLEKAFERNHYVVGQERKDLAAELSLTETQVGRLTCIYKRQVLI